MRQRIRRTTLLISLLLFQIIMWYFSPYIIINAAMEHVINGSFIVFLVMLVFSMFFGRVWCGYLCPAGGLQEEQASNELRYETPLKLYFGGAADRSITLRNIQIFEEDVKRNLAVLNMYKDNLEKVLDEEDHIFYYLTVTFGIDTYEAYLKWCTKAKEMVTFCRK